MNTFCTISTGSHLFKTFALARSIQPLGVPLQVLVTDHFNHGIAIPENITLFTLNQVTDTKGIRVTDRYKNNPDKLRWSLKPVFIKQLLQVYDKVIYLDNDLFFYSDPLFLFDELENHRILLTPHFYPSDPLKKQNWFEASFRVGLYNAGFFAANRDATPVLDWWADCCLYNMKKVFARGLFDDQKYLDLLPVIFEGVKVLKHRGCNLAAWNCFDVSHERINGQVYIDKMRLVFIHFAELSMITFSATDHFFYPEYKTYMNRLLEYNPEFRFKRKLWSAYSIKAYLNYKWWQVMRIFESL